MSSNRVTSLYKTVVVKDENGTETSNIEYRGAGVKIGNNEFSKNAHFTIRKTDANPDPKLSVGYMVSKINI